MRASVIIPAYNASRFIAETLDSVLAEAGEQAEVVVVDDGSTDDTLATVEAYGPRVRCFHQSNGGPAAARNKAIELSRGEILFFFDADDVMLPGRITRALELFDRYPQLGLVLANARIIDSGGTILNEDFLAGYETVRSLAANGGDYHIIPRNDAHMRLVAENFIVTSGVAMPRRVLDGLGGFDPGYICGEDWDLWMRVTERYDIGYLPLPLLAYRVHDLNTSTVDPVRNYASQIAVLVKHMSKSTDEEFRRHALSKIGLCYFSLAYFHHKNGDRALARTMLSRVEAGVPRAKVWSTWLKTWLMPARTMVTSRPE